MKAIQPMELQQTETEQFAISSLEERGFDKQFRVEETGFRVVENNDFFLPEELEILEIHRFEGKSNVEDMSIVYGLRGKDGTKGILIDAFGPYAEPKLGDLIEKVPLSAGQPG